MGFFGKYFLRGPRRQQAHTAPRRPLARACGWRSIQRMHVGFTKTAIAHEHNTTPHGTFPRREFRVDCELRSQGASDNMPILLLMAH